jgi:23S rRNA pseudouridine2605 synthase
MSEKTIRIAKHMAHLGYCSRREAERLISEGGGGRVRVNHVLITTPATLVSVDDIISVDGKDICKKAPKMWLYHKPRGLMTTHKDPQNRPTVFDALPKKMGHVISVGRLDLNSEGLLLLTNEPSFAQRAMRPNGWERVYHVKVFGYLPERFFDTLHQTMIIDGMHYQPMKASYLRGTGKHHWLCLILCEGKNREIRRIMEHYGLAVSRLIRTHYGPYALGNIPQGACVESDFLT